VPIYEFYCADCHRVFNFLSRSVNTSKQPACPACGRPEIARRVSAFAISKGRSEPEAGGLPDVDDARLERAMEKMAAEAEGLSEDDPRQSARLMRKLFDAVGTSPGGGMEEALRRLEAGDDPEAVEAEMGDVFDEDPFAAASSRRLGRPHGRPAPSVDPSLYEL